MHNLTPWIIHLTAPNGLGRVKLYRRLIGAVGHLIPNTGENGVRRRKEMKRESEEVMEEEGKAGGSRR